MPMYRTIGAVVVLLLMLIAGTFTAVKLSTDYLLDNDATSTARNWARYVTENVKDLEEIAAGERPSAASMVFFRLAQNVGEVFRYEIFNRYGYSQFVSDRGKISPVDVSEYNTEAARSIATGQPIVNAKKGEGLEWPPFFAQAYVPVIVDQHSIAIVAAYVDQTAQRNQFYKTFLITAASLCALTGAAFGIPAFAWYRRTKEKQQVDRRVRFLAHHDVLTGLSNRARLVDKLGQALTELPARGCGLALHFIDLDRFKEVNDTFGHDGGDFLLKTIAERLRAVTRPGDVIARIGGDEFIALQTAIKSKDEADEFAHRLTSALTMPMQFNGQAIVPTMSVGVALAPADGDTSERLLKSADLALYRCKTDGRNCIRFFQPEMDAELLARIEIEKTIRKAVLHDGFELHYQPTFEIASRRLIGFEALIRLPAEDGTLIPPAVFIPVAEDIRLIDQIGAWVLREACRTAATWPPHLTVAVNLSPAQFKAGSVSAIVADALEQAGLAPHRLELEITESLLLGESESIMAQLRTLKKMGVAVVMDDFGTGNSSLSYLWRFPFDKIKIDRSFMLAFGESGHDAETVVKTIIALGRELHMHVTVEGVETSGQATFLDQVNADMVQGFYFGRPVPACDVGADILADFQRATAKDTFPLEAEAILRLIK